MLPVPNQQRGSECSRAVVTWYALTRTWPSVHGKYLNPRVSPPTGLEASIVLTCVMRLRYHHLRGLHVAFTHDCGVGKIGEENKAARSRRSDLDYSESAVRRREIWSGVVNKVREGAWARRQSRRNREVELQLQFPRINGSVKC